VPSNRQRGKTAQRTVEGNMENRNSSRQRRAWLTTQMVTLARFPLAVGFAGALLSLDRSAAVPQSSSGLIVCGILLALMELTDVLDGILARKMGVVSEWGATLDPYFDSISRITVYWAMAYRGLAMAVVPLVMVCRDVTVAYCRIILARSGRSVSAKRSGKIKGQFQSIGGILILLGPLYWKYTGTWTIRGLSWVVIVVTAGSVVEYAAAAISASKAVRKETKETPSER
jgi:CDP-diacylglycerol--glycerol-3-phosphate 3-phosphatidyltransferase